MSVHGMKPTFIDREGYLQWRREWRDLYKTVTADIRKSKTVVLAKSREYNLDGRDYMENDHYLDLSKMQSELHFKRVMARKLMTVLEEGKLRAQQIRDMTKGVAEQFASFPLSIEDARNIDFHFNKKSIEFPVIPPWVLKAKGKTYYINHIDCSTAWTTRETPDHPSTKGSLRIKRGNIHINQEGYAEITA